MAPARFPSVFESLGLILGDFVGARAINVGLALWLLASTFIWRHSYVQSENAWVVGGMALIMALGGLSGLGWTRYVNVLLGVWLIISPLFVRILNPLTIVNSVLVGFGLIAFGLMPRLRNPRSRSAPLQR